MGFACGFRNILKVGNLESERYKKNISTSSEEKKWLN